MSYDVHSFIYCLFACNTKKTHCFRFFPHFKKQLSLYSCKSLKQDFIWLIHFILASSAPCRIFHPYTGVFCAFVPARLAINGKPDFPAVLSFLSSTSFRSSVGFIDSITIRNTQKRRLRQKDFPSPSINFLGFISCNFLKRLRVTFTLCK